MSAGYAFNKSYAQGKHAEKRARQRYGIEMSPARQARVAQLVLAGVIRGTRHEFSKYEIFDFDWRLAEPDAEKQIVKIAFDTKTKRVATFLPNDWTPDRGLEHYLDHRREREEAVALAKAEMFRKVRAEAESTLKNVHPLPVPTGDALADNVLIRTAIERLQADHDDDPTYRILRSERLRKLERMLAVLKPQLREIKRLEHEARQAEEAKLAREKKAAEKAIKDAPKPRPVMSDEDVEQHVENYAHALSQAIKELVEDRDAREVIFKRARKIMRVLRKEQHAEARRNETEDQEGVVATSGNDCGGDDAVVSQVWETGEG